MKKDDIIELTIEDLGIDGEGIGKADGMALFVKDAVVGDRIRAKIMKMKKTKLVIQQAENGTYFTQVSKGVRPDGKRNRRMFTGSTEDEVYFKATKWLKGIEEEERNPYTVREAMLQFIDSRSRVLEPTTLCCYREMLRNKLQYIMDIKIEDLTARDIQIAINVDTQRLGYKSIKNAIGFLRAVLNANDITIKMGSIRLPKKEVRERRLPSADVIYAIVKGTSSEPMSLT